MTVNCRLNNLIMLNLYLNLMRNVFSRRGMKIDKGRIIILIIKNDDTSTICFSSRCHELVTFRLAVVFVYLIYRKAKPACTIFCTFIDRAGTCLHVASTFSLINTSPLGRCFTD